MSISKLNKQTFSNGAKVIIFFALFFYSTFSFANIVILQHHTRHEVFQKITDYLSNFDQCYDGEKKVYRCEKKLNVVDIDCDESESECFKKYKDKISIIYSPSKDWDLTNFTKISVRVFHNLLGFRVPVLMKKNTSEFISKLKNMEVKKMPLAFNLNWRDHDILKSEGYNLLSTNTYSEMIESVKNGKAFYTLRALEEVYSEPEITNNKELTILSKYIFYYPYDVDIYINHKKMPEDLILYHRLKHIDRFNPDYFLGSISSNINLTQLKSCYVFLGGIKKYYKIHPCNFKNVVKAIAPK